MIQRVKRLSPEEIAMKIRMFDQEVCTQLFLSELKPVLPSPEQVGKLNVYRNASEDELATLHPSDRLMVQLIKIERLGPRLEAMLYKTTFDEQFGLLDEVCDIISNHLLSSLPCFICH
jgi:cytokinesis protein